jgi:hypothetical protein
MHGAPAWLKEPRLEKVIAQIQSKLEWDIRRVNVFWYTDETTFAQIHGLGYGGGVVAFSRRSDQTIHLGPRVATDNFDGVFGHELVHIILYQKYKNAIPAWLDEGLANYLSQHGKVDYAWLATQPPGDIHALAHPFSGGGPDGGATRVRFCYEASTAVMEMIASKCSVADMLQLSVGSKLENYLSTLCGISDINADFRAWVAKKAKP